MRSSPAAAFTFLLALAAPAAAQDPTPPTWSFPTGERIADLAVSPDGKRLYLADGSGQIWIHDAADGKELGRLPEHRTRLSHMTFVGADPSLLVTATRAEFVRTWDAAVGIVRRRFTLPGNPPPEETDEDGNVVPTREHVFAVAAARDTPLVAMANPNHRVEFWDLAADRSAGSFTFAGHAVAAAFAPDATRLALSVAADAGVDHAVQVFRMAGGPPLWKDGVGAADSDAAARDQYWFGLEFSPDGKDLLAWSWSDRDGKVRGGLRLHDGTTGRRKWTNLYDFGVWRARFSPGGDRIAFASKHGVSLFDPATGEEVLALESKAGAMGAIAFSPDGRFLYGAPWQADGIVRWDLAGEVRAVEPVRPRSGTFVSTAPAGVGPAPPPASPTARPADVPRAGLDHGAAITSLALSPDGRRVATGGKDGAVRVFDVATGARAAEFKGVGGSVTWVGWIASDADRLAAAGSDGVVRSWSVASRKKRGEFDAKPRAGVNAGRIPSEFAASPTAAEVFVGAADGTLRAFDTDTGTVRASVVIDEAFGATSFMPSSVAVSADGKRLVVVGTDLLRGTKGRVLDRDASGSSFKAASRLAGSDGDEPVELWRTVGLTRDGASALALSEVVPLDKVSKTLFVGIVRCWDVSTGAVRWRLDRPESPRAGALSPRGDVFAFSQRDGVHLVSVAAGTDVRTLPGLGGDEITCLAFVASGARLFAGTASGAVRSWDVPAAK